MLPQSFHAQFQYAFSVVIANVLIEENKAYVVRMVSNAPDREDIAIRVSLVVFPPTVEVVGVQELESERRIWRRATVRLGQIFMVVSIMASGGQSEFMGAVVDDPSMVVYHI